MKNVPNKITVHKKDANPESGYAAFSDLIRIALNSPPPGGFTPTVMRQRARIDDILDKSKPGDVLKLEDADVETVKSALQGCQWLIRSKDLIELFGLFGI
jgi:hypothetical protein